MDLKALQDVKTILVHGNCADGIASAILLHDVLPDARIQFIQYGSPEHKNLKIEPNMLIADFSPQKEHVAELIAAGCLILDHHKGVKDIVAAFGDNGRFGDEETDPGVCGAVLCYQHVWFPLSTAKGADCFRGVGEMQAARDFAILAGIRDTWQRSDYRWSEACAQAEVLNFYPENTWLDLERPFSGYYDNHILLDRMALGKILLDKKAQKVSVAVGKSWRYTTESNTRVLVFEGTDLTSDVSDTTKDVDLVIGFNYAVEKKHMMTISTRSRTGYDCLSLCKFHGGGGHTAAAGFTCEVNSEMCPYSQIDHLVNQCELGKEAT